MKTIMKFIWPAFVALAVALAPLGLQAEPPLGLFASINGPTDCGFDQNFAGAIFHYREISFAGRQIGRSLGLSRPRGLAFDSSANLFVATTCFDDGCPFQAAILKFSGGVQTTFGTITGNFYAEGVAIDATDNIFVLAINLDDPNLASTIFKFTQDGTQSIFGSTVGQSFGLAFDSEGNLFATDGGLEAAGDETIWKFAPDGTRTVFVGPSAFINGEGPVGLAFDQSGNLFVSTEPPGIPPPNGEGRILKFTPDGVETPFAAVHNYARGLAFDSAGNLFVAQVGLVHLDCSGTSGDILKFAPDGTRTAFTFQNIGNGNAGPEFLTFR